MRLHFFYSAVILNSKLDYYIIIDSYYIRLSMKLIIISSVYALAAVNIFITLNHQILI